MSQPCTHRAAGALCESCAVRSLSVCAALAPEELCALERIAQAQHFAARDTLFREGEPAGAVFNVTAGAVRLSKVRADGRRQILGFALPGDFLGLAEVAVWPFSAEALGPVTACRFAREAHHGLVEAKPHLLRRLHEYATHELTMAQEQIVLLGRRTAAERLAAFLLTMRRRWAQMNGSASVTVPLPMGRQDIADYLGLTIETVSRMFQKLVRARLIVIVPDGVRLLDVGALGGVAEGAPAQAATRSSGVSLAGHGRGA